VASLVDASKLLGKEKMHLSVLRAKTVEFAVQKYWWIINPDSNRFSHVWQVVTNFALAFVALVTPLQVGLLEIRWDALFVITWCVDIIFMIDMVLQFVTMYPKTTARGLELESRPWKIAKHYVMTWFFLDFLTLIPLDTIGLLSGKDRLKDLRSDSGAAFVEVDALAEKLQIDPPSGNSSVHPISAHRSAALLVGFDFSLPLAGLRLGHDTEAGG